MYSIYKKTLNEFYLPVNIYLFLEKIYMNLWNK